MADPDPQPLTPSVGSQPAVRRRIGALGWTMRVVAALLLLIGIAWAVLYITRGRFLKPTFERYASSAAGREVRVGGDFQLYLDPITIKFRAERLTVANPAWRKGQVFAAQAIETRIATVPLFWGTRRVKVLDMTGARIDLAWDAARKRNTFTFGNPNKPAEPFEMPQIVQARVVRTVVDYTDPLFLLTSRIRIETVNAADTRFADDIRFTGDGRIRGIGFTMTGGLLSPNETAAGGRNQLRLNARSGATAIDVAGTLPGATIIDGADLRVTARGENIARLFDFLGVAVPDTRRYRVVSQMTKQGSSYRFTRLRGRFGNSDIAGRLTVSIPADRIRMDADLATRSLDIIDAGPFIGYQPQVLARGGSVVAAAGGGGRILPDAPLRIEAIKRFDADVKYRIADIRAPNLPISDVRLHLKLDRSLLRLDPLTFNLAGGRLASNISIDARQRPVFTRYDVRLSDTPMGTLLARFGTDQAGTSGTIRGRVQMTGSGDSVRQSLATSNGRIAIIMPRGTFWTRNVQLSELDIGVYLQRLLGGELKRPVQINCGLAAFTVRNGVAAADPILVDTVGNVIVGRGGFSFRNERLDLAVRADSKKISLFSGQSPIGVEGSFASPGIRVISPELVGRAGAGLGLALFATPAAGLLAFVDVGDAKSAQCGPVLAGARAAAQRTTRGGQRDDVGRGTPSKSEDGKNKKFLGIF